MAKKIECYGFYNASRVCEKCPQIKDCSYTLVAVGFDIIRSTQEEMTFTLPEGLYIDADRMPVLADQLVGIKLPEPDPETLQVFDGLQDEEIDLAKTI